MWTCLCIGILGSRAIKVAWLHDMDSAQAVSEMLNLSMLPISAQGLAFFAILTSFLIQGLTISHFLRDALHLAGRRHESTITTLMALLPPLVLSLLFPQLFFKALGFAGGICAVILFGVLPVMMVYKGRYKMKHELSDKVFGGKVLLTAILVFAILVFIYQCLVIAH